MGSGFGIWALFRVKGFWANAARVFVRGQEQIRSPKQNLNGFKMLPITKTTHAPFLGDPLESHKTGPLSSRGFLATEFFLKSASVIRNQNHPREETRGNTQR